jgi:hypothetical protein
MLIVRGRGSGAVAAFFLDVVQAADATADEVPGFVPPSTPFVESTTMSRSHLSRWIPSIGCFVAFAAVAQASNIYYVKKSGNDSNDGSFANPWLTINHAIAQASSGDTINVGPGTYAQNVVIDKDLKLEALSTARIEIQAQFVHDYNVGILIDSDAGAITAASRVRGFTVDGGPVSGADRPSIGILARDEVGSPDFGPYELSPQIESNTILDVDYGVVVDARGENTVSFPTIRHNRIEREDDEDCNDGHAISGMELLCSETAEMEAFVRSNQVLGYENGIYIHDFYGAPSGGAMTAHVQCDVLAFNGIGVFADGTSEVWITNETIAYGMPSISVPQVFGVLAVSSSVSVMNSIIWIPDSLSASASLEFPCGLPEPENSVDLEGVDADYSIVEDASPTSDPLFVDPVNHDFRLQSSSPAIDAGDTCYVAPAGYSCSSGETIDYDNDGAPRVQDVTRSATLEVDIGAYEAATTAITITSDYDGTSNAGPIVNAKRGATLAFTATTSFAGDYKLWGYCPASNANLLLPFQGNCLLDLGTMATLGFTGGSATSGTYSFIIPPTTPLESEFDLQAIFVDPTDATLGSFTRRIRVQVNE